jgi:hypothetical protein
MTKSFEKRKEHLEKQLRKAREKLKRMKRGKREYRSGPAALLWRAFTSKPTLDHIRASWSEEQMQRMVERGRAEFHRRRLVPERAKRCREGPPKSGQSATKLAGCFYRVIAAAGEAEKDAGERVLADPEGVFASGALKAAAERWLSGA